jgi:hypothetical protein
VVVGGTRKPTERPRNLLRLQPQAPITGQSHCGSWPSSSFWWRYLFQSSSLPGCGKCPTWRPCSDTRNEGVQKRGGAADKRLRLDCAPTYEAVLQAIMAGCPAIETIPQLQDLPSDDRQTILCTVCSISNEIVCNCRDHGNEVLKLLTSECPRFIDGRATCLLPFSNDRAVSQESPPLCC